MRRTFFILVMLWLPYGALYGQNPFEIILDEKFENEELTTILNQIDNKYPVTFYYKNAWLPQKKITLELNNIPLPEALSQILDNTHLGFVIYNSSIILAPEDQLGQEFSKEFYITRKKQQNLLQSQKWSSASSIISLGDSTKTDIQGQVEISGNVSDKLNGEPLVGVNFYFEALDYSIASDTKGDFKMRLPPGYNLMEASYIGYESVKVLLRVYGRDQLNIKMFSDAHELDEVLITGETDDANVQSSIIGITRLNPKQIKELPVFMGEADVIKSILTLPGVSTVGEGAGGFNVRGGNIDQNLILQDEALIFNSSHALGFFSVFNPDAIREVTLYKGHIPAQYGGRLSSVLDVKLKGTSSEKFNLKGGIGMVSSRLVLETPLRFTKKEKDYPPKTTLLVGGRITYSDWMLRIVNNPQVNNSSASFYDFNLKLNHRYSDNGTITATYYQSYDFVQFTNEFGFSWKNNAGSIIWNHVISPSLTSTFSASTGNSNNLSFEPAGIGAFNLTNGLSNFRFKEDLLYSKFKKHSIVGGGEFIRYNINQDEISPRIPTSTIIPESVEKDNGQELGLFINDEYTINHLVSVSVGLRFNIFQQIGPSTVYIYEEGVPRTIETITDTLTYNTGEVVKTFQAFEPRFSIKYSLNPTSSIKLAYNRMNQYIHLISNTTAAVPIDFWQVSGPYYAPERADNFSLGYFKNFKNNLYETSVETYYRKLQNQIEYKDLPELLLNETLETELLSGTGKAYGLELFLKKKRGSVHGWVSYAYARSFIKILGDTPEETINNGEWFPSKLDKPHNLNVVLNIDFNKSNMFSANFTLNSGRPITAPDLNYQVDDVVLPHYSDRNGYRIPTYHRLDLSYTLKRNVIKKRRYKDSFTFAIYNLYARKNAYSIFFRKQRATGVNAYKLSILGSVFPSITYNFEF